VPRTFTNFTLALTLAGAVTSAAACSSGQPASPSMPPPDGSGAAASTPPGVLPFQADPPSVYVAKVKNILVGMPPTDEEVKAVEADASKLKSLIDGWMAMPEYQDKMLTFFQLAFQQTQVSIIDFSDQTFPRPADISPFTAPLLVQNLKESFARTVLELATEGRPLSEAMTTHTFMMTPALMEFYAFLDAWQVDDMGRITDRFRTDNPGLTVTVSAASGSIPIEDTLNPASPNYMHWYNPDVGIAQKNEPAGCVTDPITYPPTGISLHFLLLGALDNRKNPDGGAPCNARASSPTSAQLTNDDFNTWKMVTTRAPKAGEKPTRFYDLPTLRSSKELVIATPRVGFFTTPAFFANWQTNDSNEMRVTTNQMLIVATGAQIDGTDTTFPSSTPGLDTVHASDPACSTCHRLMDPTRSILAATYSWNYHAQTEAKFADQKGLFAFQGVVKPVNSIDDLGTTLAQHPLFPQAWAQKLCYYANSSACIADDPEFQRVVSVFQSSGLSWNALVRELLASPLTTNAVATKTTTTQGEVVAVARRDHLCAALNDRLGFADVCGLDVVRRGGAQGTIPTIAAGLPSDGYGRGSTAPVLPNQPSLFFRAGLENICGAVATMVIDPAKPTPGAKQWSSAQPDAAIADFVHIVMALAPSDPRAAAAQAALKEHFTSAQQQQGIAATDALQSTFVVACLAPSAVSIGL